jgi:hypothetical protein
VYERKARSVLNEMSSTKNDVDDANADNTVSATNGGVPPPMIIVDPLSFPRTDDGLKKLLSIVDADYPFENGYTQTSNLCYQASDIHIPAGTKMDIPLPPIERDGSKVEWTVTVIDPYNERLDIEFGLVVIVNGEDVVAREMGRIASPIPTNNSGDGEDNTVSAKGKFTVSNSAPVTIVIKLDNVYSWIKPKKINYTFQITSPVDENMIQRSLRAKSVLPRILGGQAELVKAKEDSRGRVEALSRIKLEMENKKRELLRQMDKEIVDIESIQKTTQEVEIEAMNKANEIKDSLSQAKKEEQSILECTTVIIALEEECAQLKKKIAELKIERTVREEEKVNKERDAEKCRDERIQLQNEIQQKKQEYQSKLMDMDGLEKECVLLQSNLNDLEKERQVHVVEENDIIADLKFLQRQIDAVKLRFME